MQKRDKYDREQFEQYLSGQLKGEEANAFERDVLNDPFAGEALEGFERMNVKEAFDDIRMLEGRLRGKRKKKAVWMKVAAAVALLVVSSLSVWFIVQAFESEQKLAMGKKKPEVDAEQNRVIADSTVAEGEVVAEEMELSEEDADATQKEMAATKGENQMAFAKRPAQAAAEKPSLAEVPPAIAEPFKAEEGVKQLAAVAGGMEEVEEIAVELDVEVTDDAVVEEIVLEEVPALTNVEFYSDEMVASESLEKEEQVTGSALSSKKAKKARARSAASISAPSQITGVVQDDEGYPLPSVTVLVKGTTNGTVTDIEGRFSLAAEEGTTLAVSFIGFNSTEVKVRDGEEMTVTLSSDVEALQEVVVTGYGAQSGEHTPPILIPAKPEGGMKSYKDYLEKNLQYPEEAYNNEIEGTVVLDVTINTDGSVGNVSVRKSMGNGCDEEAIRLVKNGPKWQPATSDEIPISDVQKVKVKFKL